MNIKRSIEALYLLLMITLRLIMLAMIAATLAIGTMVVGTTSLISLVVVVLAWLSLLSALLFHEEARQKLLRAFSLLLGPIPGWLGYSFILPSLLLSPLFYIIAGISVGFRAYTLSAGEMWGQVILAVFSCGMIAGAAASLSVLAFRLLYNTASGGLQALLTRIRSVRRKSAKPAF